jgi:large subunit ribosomal protein L19
LFDGFQIRLAVDYGSHFLLPNKHLIFLQIMLQSAGYYLIKRIMATVTNTQFIPAALAARKELDLRAGDTVRVHVKIQEKGKTRIQMFEGLVLARKHGSEAGATFTVRKISHGVGVERIFPLYSPSIDKIEIIRRAKVRRAKLYFIREKVSKMIRRKMRNFKDFFISSNDLVVPESEMMDEVVEEVIETPEVSESNDSVEPTEETQISEE